MTRYDGFHGVREINFEASFADPAGVEQFRAVEIPREWTVHLAAGQKWPEECRRGRRVTFEVSAGDYRRVFSGTVKFRRLNKLVLLTT